MVGVHDYVDVDEETNSLNIPRVHKTGLIPDYIMSPDGTQLIHTSIKCPFYDSPLAVANPGLSAMFDDVPGMWYSDGVRWRPSGGRIVIGAIYYDDVPATSSTTAVSQFKFKIPYSLLNGSLFRDKDQLKIQSSFQRLSLNDSVNLLRSIYIGSDSSIHLNNRMVHETSSTSANDGISEHEFCFRRMDSTTVQILGTANAFNMFGGASPTDLASPLPTASTSDIANMDINDTYIDWCLRFASASTDAAVLYNATVEFVAAGV